MKAHERHTTTMLILLIVVIIGGAFYFFFMPKIRSINTLQAEVATLSRRLSEVRRYRDELHSLRDEVNRLSAQLTLTESRFITGEQVLTVINEIADTARSYQLRLVNIEPPDINLISDGKSGSLPVHFRLYGRFIQIGKFIEQLENLQYAITIREIKISSSPDLYPQVLAEITFDLYKLK